MEDRAKDGSHDQWDANNSQYGEHVELFFQLGSDSAEDVTFLGKHLQQYNCSHMLKVIITQNEAKDASL